ncbi:MAG: hypothetical protein QXT14_08965 [Candidatus Bathyarchaeia archaeon]
MEIKKKAYVRLDENGFLDTVSVSWIVEETINENVKVSERTSRYYINYVTKEEGVKHNLNEIEAKFNVELADIKKRIDCYKDLFNKFKERNYETLIIKEEDC